MSITINPNNVENAYVAVYNRGKDIPSKPTKAATDVPLEKATEVNISPEAKELAAVEPRWSPTYELKTVVEHTFDHLKSMKNWIKNIDFEQYSTTDLETIMHDVRNERDLLWYGTNSGFYTVAEWDQFGKIENNKKIIDKGDDKINSVMTEFFNYRFDLYTPSNKKSAMDLLTKVEKTLLLYV